MSKKVIIGIIIALLIAMGIFIVVNRGSQDSGEGLVIVSSGQEISVAWDNIDARPFEGELVNGKGERSNHEYTGAELSEILESNDCDVNEDSIITVVSEDNYSAELTGAEIAEKGKVYVALTDGGEQIEGIDGGQGAQLIVFGDPNSKRAVRYMKSVEIR